MILPQYPSPVGCRTPLQTRVDLSGGLYTVSTVNLEVHRRPSVINTDNLPVREQKGALPTMKKLGGLLDILIIYAPVGILAYAGSLLGTGPNLSAMLIHLGYLLMMVVGWRVLKMRGSGWGEIAFGRPESWPRTLFFSAVTAIALLLLILAVQFVFLNLPGIEIPPVDDSRFEPLAGNLPMLLTLVVLTWTTNAFGEEMFFRAILINKLGEILGHTKLGWTLAVMVSSVAFGLSHFHEGVLGIVYTTLGALVLGWAYFRTGRRNLWVTVIAHGSVNTLRFILVFLGAGSIFLS
jgi:membrane protease YdiL (CAAX protease family)